MNPYSETPVPDEPPLEEQPTVTSATADTSAAESPVSSANAVLARREHVADALQVRHTLKMGASAWAAFGLMDVAVGLLIRPEAIPTLLAIRYLLFLGVAPLLWRAHRPPLPSERLLRFFDATPSLGVAFAVSLQCVFFGGIESVLAPGVVVAVLVRGALVHESWRRGLPIVAAMVLSFPLVMLLAAPFDDAIAAQLGERAALARGLAICAFLLGAGGVSLASGDAFWRIRRQALDDRAVGPYLLEQKLGAGGMGDVWRAQKSGRASVALKLLRPAASGLERAVVRFEREIAALAKLSHPNIVRVLDYGVSDNGIWYYAMELIGGEDLEDRIDRLGRLPEAEVRVVAEQLSAALAAAHESGIVHRDVKPSNVRLEEGRVDRLKLLDFGIAHLAQGSELTATGAVVGTPTYMAPEAARGSDVDARTDVYSVGATLYHAIGGEPPYDGPSSLAVVTRVLAGPPPPLGTLAHDASPELIALVERAMSRDPADRWADCGEMLRALRALGD